MTDSAPKVTITYTNPVAIDTKKILQNCEKTPKEKTGISIDAKVLSEVKKMIGDIPLSRFTEELYIDALKSHKKTKGKKK